MAAGLFQNVCMCLSVHAVIHTFPSLNTQHMFFPPSSIVYYNNTVKGTGGGRLQMRYQSHQINQMGRIIGEEGVWCKFPSV